MGININDLPEHIRDQARRKILEISPTVQAPNMERTVGNGAVGKKKSEGLDTRCSINLHSRRKRLADSDGISGKAAIDGLKHGGLLQNDDPRFVKEVSHSQEKCKKDESEQTIITLTW